MATFWWWCHQFGKIQRKIQLFLASNCWQTFVGKYVSDWRVRNTIQNTSTNTCAIPRVVQPLVQLASQYYRKAWVTTVFHQSYYCPISEKCPGGQKIVMECSNVAPFLLLLYLCRCHPLGNLAWIKRHFAFKIYYVFWSLDCVVHHQRW